MRLPASYGVGEVVGRCGVSLRFSRASWRGGWWLGAVGSKLGTVQLRRTATASPAATGHGRADGGVRAVPGSLLIVWERRGEQGEASVDGEQ